jgi:hypothetical protein
VRGALLLVALASLPASADDAPPAPTPFDQGRVSISGGAGKSSSSWHNWYVIGAGVGYYVLDGVELSLHGSYQFGDFTSVSELSPQVRYVAEPLFRGSPVVPYVGVFYNHWFIGDDYNDVDTVGVRAGGLFTSGTLMFGLGVVVEHVLTNCPEDGARCVGIEDSVYPDVTLGFVL